MGRIKNCSLPESSSKLDQNSLSKVREEFDNRPDEFDRGLELENEVTLWEQTKSLWNPIKDISQFFRSDTLNWVDLVLIININMKQSEYL